MIEEPATKEELARFMSYVDVLPNGCHFWTGARSRGKGNKKWYGTFYFRGRSIRAHRFICDYVGEVTPLPPGHDRSHSCDFSLCVNKAHLSHQPSELNNAKRHRKFVNDSEKSLLSFVEPSGMIAA